MGRWHREMEEVLSSLTLAFLQLERSGKCCHGLTLSQCHTLGLLSKKGSLTMNELSKQMGLAKSTMTRVVDNMVREGWIERAKICGDNRRVSVRLTRKGKGLAEKLEASSQGAVQDIFKYIPPGRLPRVVESMKWVVRAMEKGVQKNGR